MKQSSSGVRDAKTAESRYNGPVTEGQSSQTESDVDSRVRVSVRLKLSIYSGYNGPVTEGLSSQTEGDVDSRISGVREAETVESLKLQWPSYRRTIFSD